MSKDKSKKANGDKDKAAPKPPTAAARDHLNTANGFWPRVVAMVDHMVH